jgi:hypothetical protein
MPHYGKYRGTVVGNLDPLQLGRLQVRVPGMLGTTPSGWAYPCLPPGSLSTLPKVGDAVWVEFEQGNADHPIWCGVFWNDAAEVPDALRQPATEDSMLLRTADGARIEIGAAGIVIDNGKGARIAMAGPSVSINHGALEIV